MLAIVAAVREEMAPLLRAGEFSEEQGPGEALLYRGEILPGNPALILISGIGQSRAEETTGWLVRNHRPDLVIGVGFAGATHDALDAGTVVIATSVSLIEGTPLDWSLGADVQTFESDPAFAAVARMAVEIAGIDFVQGPSITVPIIARSPGMKKWLGARFGVYSVDLESYWVARATIAAGMPFLGVRVIVDSTDMTLPGLVTEMPGAPTGGRTARVIRYAARDPRRIVELTRLGRASSRAARQLGLFLTAFAKENSSPGEIASEITGESKGTAA
ncbi:MAG: hypothetical protein IH868_00500 [Chloroflexi bacterium]|nr:hypothetical protein [Chloroflexota bacterium]